MSRGGSAGLDRLLRVRRLMEEISRTEVGRQRRLQAERQAWMQTSSEAAHLARQEACNALCSAQDRKGQWRLLYADGERNRQQAAYWRERARQAGEAATEAEVLYLENRRRRMQVETLLAEQAAAAALDASRREQQLYDEWFSRQRQTARRSSAEGKIEGGI